MDAITPNSTKILIISANPKNSNRIRIDEEVREVEQGLERSKRRTDFNLSTKWASKIQDLRRALLDEVPKIVHFSGHGTTDGIYLEDESGNSVLVASEALSELFSLFSSDIELVILNSCYSKEQAEAISKHINYVIGMSKSVQDKAAIEFSVGFYDALCAGKTIEESFRFGTNAIALYNLPDNLTPIMYRKSIDVSPAQNCKVQLIITGNLADFDSKAQKQVKNILAELLQIDNQSVKIIRAYEGSVILDIEIPVHAEDNFSKISDIIQGNFFASMSSVYSFALELTDNSKTAEDLTFQSYLSLYEIIRKEGNNKIESKEVFNRLSNFILEKYKDILMEKLSLISNDTIKNSIFRYMFTDINELLEKEINLYTIYKIKRFMSFIDDYRQVIEDDRNIIKIRRKSILSDYFEDSDDDKSEDNRKRGTTSS